MESITREEVPTYLRNGLFFENLDSLDKGMFEVPSDCLKKDPKVTNLNDLTSVLRSARFWGLDVPPFTVITYVVRNIEGLGDGFDTVITEFPEYRTFLASLSQVSHQAAEKVTCTALQKGLGVGVLKHLHEQDCFPLTSEAFIAAIEMDDSASMKYMLQQGKAWPSDAVSQMVSNRSLQCLKFTLETFKFDTSGLISCAVVSEQIEVVRYLLDFGIVPGPNAMVNAIARGNVEVVRMLHRAGCAWPENTIYTCVALNYMDCLIYAHESGCPWTWTHILCTTAAAHGYIRCLEYLHLHGCPWATVTLITAAMNNQFECLQYAHQRGCPLTPDVTEHAIIHGAFRCTLYCLWYGAIGPKIGSNMFFVVYFSFVGYVTIGKSVFIGAFFLLLALDSLVAIFRLVRVANRVLLILRIVLFVLGVYLLYNLCSYGWCIITRYLDGWGNSSLAHCTAY